MEISGLMASAYSTAANSAAKTSGSGTSGKTVSSTSGSLDMTDFLKLLAAQFQNQDVMNPTDNTEYISELAQFSSIQAMNNLTTYANRQYASSLIGKTVLVSAVDSSGKRSVETGKVSCVDFSSSDGTCAILVNNHAYDLSSVVQVQSDAAATDTGASGKTDAGGSSAGSSPAGA